MCFASCKHVKNLNKLHLFSFVCVCVCVLTNKACHKRLYFAVPLRNLGLTFNHPIVFGWLDACIGELPEDLPQNLPVKGRSKVSRLAMKNVGHPYRFEETSRMESRVGSCYNMRIICPLYAYICPLYYIICPLYAHYMSIICPLYVHHMPIICPSHAHYMSIITHSRFMLNSQIIDRHIW